MAKIKWTEGSVSDVFNLERVFGDYQLLTYWLGLESAISREESVILERLRGQLERDVNGWNEETLKMKFIAFIIGLVDYDIGNIHSIFDAEISAVVESHPLKVVTDFMVAKTKLDLIQTPYFYFHEYKRKKRNADDPVAQVLLAMLIAQEKNKNGKPLYGCHIIGEFWYFMVMEGKQYSIAPAFDATNAVHLQRILMILRGFKQILESLLTE